MLIEEIRAKVEKLEDLLRLARDINAILRFRLYLEETGGVVDLIVFATGERIFTKLSPEEIDAIDKRIAEMIEGLIAKALKLKQF